jgi:hypothetical protein
LAGFEGFLIATIAETAGVSSDDVVILGIFPGSIVAAMLAEFRKDTITGDEGAEDVLARAQRFSQVRHAQLDCEFDRCRSPFPIFVSNKVLRKSCNFSFAMEILLT